MKQTSSITCLPDSNHWFINRLGHLLMVAGILIFCRESSMAQIPFERTAPYKYRIVFTDKNNSPFHITAPLAYLSQKAIDRRTAQGILIHEKDIPVNQAYIDSVHACGARLIHVSKWFNAVTVEVQHDSILEKIARLTFVRKNTQLLTTSRSSDETYRGGIMEADENHAFNYGPSLWQTAMLNGHILHESGFTGRNIVIAVIDAGFLNADTLLAFEHLWENGQILGYRDYVDPGNDVFRESSHGMAVLSLIGGSLPGQLTGTAPDASFWLLRAEDVSTEYIIEEDNWIAAAEFADSAGADIISTSLGYNNFDDPSQDHSYADMDGNSTRISQAADIAAAKGILVVVSAGNEGMKPWHYISAPADADSVISVGAVDFSKTITNFSSRGPTSDQDVKPEVAAMGADNYVAGSYGGVTTGNGTSFAAPIIAGLSACLLQANPGISAMDLRNAIIRSADQYSNPDDSYGYGIPDFNLAHMNIQWEKNPGIHSVQAFPNPFRNQLYVYFESPVKDVLSVQLFDLSGKELLREWSYNGKYLSIENGLNGLNKGVYLLHIQSGDFSYNLKMVKL